MPPSPTLDALIHLAWGTRRSPLLDRLRTPDHDPSQFDIGIILSTGGPHRVYVADRIQPGVWEKTVCTNLPGARRLLDAAPSGTRRMVDVDGLGFAEVYLDDLQVQQPDLGVMCLIWSRETDRLSRVRPVAQVPRRFSEWSVLQRFGKLAVRTGGGPPHLLWVTEARWSGNIHQTTALARDLGALPPEWTEVVALAPHAYIDAVDIHDDGTLDVTVGLLPPT